MVPFVAVVSALIIVCVIDPITVSGVVVVVICITVFVLVAYTVGAVTWIVAVVVKVASCVVVVSADIF
eukprot:4666614-Karenia_brevis.AAC.1